SRRVPVFAWLSVSLMVTSTTPVKAGRAGGGTKNQRQKKARPGAPTARNEPRDAVSDDIDFRFHRQRIDDVRFRELGESTRIPGRAQRHHRDIVRIEAGDPVAAAGTPVRIWEKGALRKVGREGKRRSGLV